MPYFAAICESDSCPPGQQCVPFDSPDPITGEMFECIGRFEEVRQDHSTDLEKNNFS